MEFRTTVKTGENRGWLHHSDSVVLLGSCFSDNIGAKMHAALFNAYDGESDGLLDLLSFDMEQL